MLLSPYLKSLINKVYKILPLRESADGKEKAFLATYISSLLMEVIGAQKTYSMLCEDVDYIALVNTLQYMNEFDLPVKECKREVFKMIRIVEKIESRQGGVKK